MSEWAELVAVLWIIMTQVATLLWIRNIEKAVSRELDLTDKRIDSIITRNKLDPGDIVPRLVSEGGYRLP